MDLTFGGTRPLERITVLGRVVCENGVPVSEHVFPNYAIIRADETAKAHGLDHFFVEGRRVETGTVRFVTAEGRRVYPREES